jgi:hypothetical protein
MMLQATVSPSNKQHQKAEVRGRIAPTTSRSGKPVPQYLDNRFREDTYVGRDSEALIPGEQEIPLMQVVAGAMARAGVLDEPPPKVSSRVEEASSKWSSSEQATTRTHFLGWETRTTLDRSNSSSSRPRRFEYCLRVRGSKIKRA